MPRLSACYTYSLQYQMCGIEFLVILNYPTITNSFAINQAPVVQRLDNAIHRINHYPADKYWQNKPRYPLDSDLSGG